VSMNRRRLLVLGGASLGVAASAPYLALVPGREFEELVADALGIDVAHVVTLLECVRDGYGPPEYEARATAFTLAVRDPVASLAPDRFRSSAIRGFLDAMFDSPAAALAFTEGRDPAAAACAGLVRST
jgi:hypothetical protein